jgi:F-type H+-transporting ATPase subunit epsilon
MADTHSDQIHLELVTPDKLVVRDPVLAVSLPGRDGYFGVLAGHAPLLSELKPGEVAYTQGTVNHYLSVNWGFAEVLSNRVTVLVETSERPEEIDVERARKARERAEERLRRAGVGDAEIDALRAQRALERAMARLEVSERASRAVGAKS